MAAERHHPHAMLGSGGRIRIPVSETQTLGGAIALITNGQYREAIDLLKQLKRQVGEGYHRNPLHFQAGQAVGKIGDDVHSIKYRHAKDGKHYQHDFNGDVDVYAIERAGKRDLLLTHRDGSALWDEF